MAETTSLGAAIAAGNAKGVDIWDMENVQPVPSDTFNPSITEDRKYFSSAIDFGSIRFSSRKGYEVFSLEDGYI